MAPRTYRIYRETVVTEEQILEILDLRGLDNILEENYMTLPFALSVLNDLGYINLEQYEDTDE